ncbi:hypothetical protein [Novosphingobium cyanobacteriorum]|uniref:UrcA family protein n=1 Tax=Novosphingobium cyanobacteriorum TaxID=3024215 RepID=A0ABT6CN51_9SPHN|nr:hypothetical protein [Novosphingobium cyanobacteriorum]MDF8335003.1 hypothetical protein [Novosphingobium cyanobacteriorum]
MTRLLAVGAALSALSLPVSAIAATTAVNYSAIVRANEKAVAQINAIKSSCGSSASDQAACSKQITKIVNSVNFRIKNSAGTDPALLPAVQRATSKQLLQIFNNSLNCPTESSATCQAQNQKTFGSLVYRITKQAPISPV